MQVLAAVAALVVGCYLFLAVRLLANHPTLAHNYRLELIAPTQGVPEADRAWPFYREALLRLTPEPFTVNPNNEPSTGSASTTVAGEPDDGLPHAVEDERPGGKYWPRYERWLDENQVRWSPRGRAGRDRGLASFITIRQTRPG